MKNLFPETEWVDTSMILEDLASVKDDYEIACIKTAVEVTDKVYEEILDMLCPGHTEKEVANKAPVDSVNINDLNSNTEKEILPVKTKFKYIINIRIYHDFRE